MEHTKHVEPVPESAVPESAVPESAVPESAVPESAVTESAVDVTEHNSAIQQHVGNMLSDLKDQLNTTIVTKLTEHIYLLLNEIELSFDYVPKNKIEVIKKQMRSNNFIESFTKETYNTLKQYESILSSLSTTKLKTKDLDFMNDIVLFNNELNFNLFANENKNTKKSLLTYLYTIYTFCIFLNKDMTDDINDSILDDLSKLTDNLQKNLECRNVEEVGTSSKKKSNVRTSNNNIPPLHMMDDLFANKEIMDVALQVTKQMQDEKINPMNILSAFMSGDMSSISGLVNSVEKTISQKIDNGDLNKDELETQSKKMLESLSSKDIPGMQGLFKNFKF